MNAKTTIRFAAAALIGLSSVAAHALPAPSTLLGSPVASEQADRTITLGEDVRSINAYWGETVRFQNAGGRSFTVKFDGVKSAFDLRDLAPAGALNHDVTVYMSTNQSVDSLL